MRLLRYGPPGTEKPGVLDEHGVIRDLSGIIDDVAGKGLCQTNANQVEFVTPGFRWTAQNTCDFQQPLGD